MEKTLKEIQISYRALVLFIYYLYLIYFLFLFQLKF